jgi:hypothetical protein
VATVDFERARFNRLANNVTAAVWAAYFLLATSIGLAWIPSWHNEQRALQVALLFASAVAMVPNIVLRGKRQFGFSGPFWLTICVGTLSAAVNGQSSHAVAEIALWLGLAGLALLAATWSTQADTSRFLCWASLLIGASQVVGVATRYVAALNLSNSVDLDVLLLGYANPRFQSALYLFLLPFIGVTWLDGKNPRSVRQTAVATGCLLWSINAALQTRAIFVAFASGAVVMIVVLGWNRARHFVLPQVVFSLVGLVLYWFFVFVLPTWLLGRSDVVIRSDLFGGVSGRDVLLTIAWQAIQGSPFLGIGPMNFAAIPNGFGAHPHNWVAQLAAEFGVPLALLVCIGVVRFVVQCGRVIRSRPEDPAQLSNAAFAAVVIALIYGLADGIFVMPVSQSAFAISLGVLIGSTRAPFAASSRRALLNTWASALAVLGASLFLVAYAAQTLPSQTENIPSYRFPRFWENGLLTPPN